MFSFAGDGTASGVFPRAGRSLRHIAAPLRPRFRYCHVSSYFVPRSSSRARCKASFYSSAFCVPSGIERLSASTSLATVEKIGPRRRRARCRNLAAGVRPFSQASSANFNFFHCLTQNSDKEGGGRETEESADEARRYVVAT